jgi:Arc/MetJ-type ribon-helix-helix transcriptional regulator
MYRLRMTMLSFRLPDRDAAQVQRWADRLGLDRSDLLRRAVLAHLATLAAEEDAAAWERVPLAEGEQSFSLIADWGPAEDWTDWADAPR